jgi:hypothetical protein
MPDILKRVFTHQLQSDLQRLTPYNAKQHPPDPQDSHLLLLLPASPQIFSLQEK